MYSKYIQESAVASIARTVESVVPHSAAATFFPSRAQTLDLCLPHSVRGDDNLLIARRAILYIYIYISVRGARAAAVPSLRGATSAPRAHVLCICISYRAKYSNRPRENSLAFPPPVASLQHFIVYRRWGGARACACVHLPVRRLVCFMCLGREGEDECRVRGISAYVLYDYRGRGERKRVRE